MFLETVSLVSFKTGILFMFNHSGPPVHTQAIPRPTVDPKKNEIPIIRPLDYRNTFNGSPKQPLTPTPVPASSVQRPKDYPGMDRNRNVINELQVKLQPTGGGPSQRSVHAAPPSSSVHLNSSASDPFVVGTLILYSLMATLRSPPR